jgi:hypothetical protein
MVKFRSTIRWIIILFIWILVFSLLAGCQVGGSKTRKPAGDFSRGLPFPTEASTSPAAAINPSGDRVQVVIASQEQEGNFSFWYYQLDDQAEFVLSQELALDLDPFIRTLKMAGGTDGSHLVWAARESTTEGWGLRHVLIDQQGQIISEPQWISQGAERVSQFDLINDPEGGLLVVWEESEEDSIQFTRLDSRGRMLISSELLIPFGERPSLALDPEGNFHLVWIQGENLKYSRLERDFSYPVLGDQVALIQVAEGNRLDGPVLSTSDQFVYIFWSILRQRGLEAGTAITEYLIIPDGEPARSQRGLVTIYPASEDLFAPHQGELSLSQLVPPPREDYLSTDYIYDPRAGAGLNNAQGVAVAGNQVQRLDAYIQILIAIFEEGKYQGYTVGTQTTELSQNPQLFGDDSGNLHLIWQEGSSGDRVYYATTAPQARANLDQVGMGDIPNLIMSGGLEALTGILLFPFAFPWMVIGLVIMVVLRLTRNDEEVTQPLSIFLLALAILSYQVSKLLFLPDMLVYVPFSAWLDLPAQLGMILRVGIPILIFALGIGVAEWFRRKNTGPTSSLRYYIAVILVDMLLTLAVYGVIFLGEY